MPLRDLLRDPLDRAGLFYPSPKFFGFVCASRPWPVKRRDPFRVGGGGPVPAPPWDRFAWVILDRNVCVFGIGNGIYLGRFLPNAPVFWCPSHAHTHNAAMHESANFPNVTDPHE